MDIEEGKPIGSQDVAFNAVDIPEHKSNRHQNGFDAKTECNETLDSGTESSSSSSNDKESDVQDTISNDNEISGDTDKSSETHKNGISNDENEFAENAPRPEAQTKY